MRATTFSILQTAKITSSEALGGGKRIENREDLQHALEVHRCVVMILMLLLLALIVAVIVASLAVAISHREQVTKGLLPYLGGATFIGLLELARRLVREYTYVTLPLTLAKFLADDEFARFIQSLMALKSSTGVRRKSKGQLGTIGRK
jgi:hypothetical protein